jgi:hypothetical protein
MDHQTFAQLLGNYGEFVGAIAVVGTLIYFGVQLRKTERAMVNSFFSGMQLARITGNSQLLEHVDLVVNANSGAELDEAQVEKLRLLCRGQATIMFFAYLNVRNLGGDGATQARTFASYLCDNPAMEALWSADSEQDLRDTQDASHPPSDWVKSVTDQLLAVKSNRSNGAT